MKTDAAAPAAGIPGLVIRRYRGEADIPDMVRVANAELAVDGIHERRTVEEAASQLRHASEQFDPARDLHLVEVDGVLVAHGRVDWVDTTDGLREYRTGGYVDPAWRRRGIGRALHRANIARLREIDAAHETDRPRVLGLWTMEQSRGAIALAESEGFRPERWFFEMERPGLDRDLPELPPLPDGLEVRPVGGDEAWQLWQADIEAFQDHWGGFDASEANFRRFIERPEWRPELFVVAWDGDEIAGGVINAIYTAENDALGMKRGWLDSVFTRRAWRRRGVARALIARSLHVLAREGLDTAALGVDADNPSGALGLYESFGFRVVQRGQAWRKPMDEGNE
ncbi:MAG TPA: GNAT family N-acetyltransferase [Candidatus Limnocylindria bacterium]